MLIRHSFDNRFITLIDNCRKKYSEQMIQLTGIGENSLDINRYSNDFFSQDSIADTTVDKNANVSSLPTITTWNAEFSKPLLRLNALYSLWRNAEKKHGIKRANKLVELEIRGSYRIHDLHGWNFSYCYAYSLSTLVNEGIKQYKKIKIGPVKHFESFCNLVVQFTCIAANNTVGACGYPDLLVYSEYFIRKDYGDDWYDYPEKVAEIKQVFQSLIYSFNFSFRAGIQSPFTNVSVFDKVWLKEVFSGHINPDFNGPDFDNITRVQKVFVEELVRNLKDNPFTFPVMTANLFYNKKENKFDDEEFFNWVAEVNAETGLFNIFHDSDISSISNCCRLKSKVMKSKEYTNSFGSGGVSIGSHRVVALNLPQIAYESETWDDFYKLLEYRINAAQDVLDIHKDILLNHIEHKRLPLYDYGFMNINKQYSTLGFIGLNECLELMGLDITSEEGYKKANSILMMMSQMNAARTAIDNRIRNVEQIPGESAAVDFVKKDKLLFDGDVKYKIYSNQYIPLTKDVDVLDRIKIQGRFDADESTSGGSILHVNLSEKVSANQMKDIILYAAKCGVTYWAMNYGISQCKKCGKTYVGQYDKSPCCDAHVNKFLRVVGFLTAVKDWSKDRQEEYKSRQFYKSF